MRFAIAIAIACASSSATAAPPTAFDAPMVLAELGLDGAMNARLGFAARLPRAAARFDLGWWVDLSWVAGDLDVRDQRARIGARVDLARRGLFRLRGALAASRRATENTGFTAQAFTSELSIAPSIVTGRWAGALEISVEQAWLAYVAPSQTYRDLVYEMAEAGWYGLPGRTLRAGGAITVRIANVQLFARAGYARTGALDFLPPFYAALGAGYRF